MNRARTSRDVSQKGAELLEFTFVFLPLIAMTFVLMDIAWAIFAQSTLQRAVRLGVRNGVTITALQTPQGSCLTDMVKSNVQRNALGLLNGTSGRARIKVNYLQPPAPSSAADAVDVSTQSSGNAPGNIMQVSVQGFPLVPLLPRFFNWKDRPDRNPFAINVYSADRIEPSRNPACIGTAP